MGLTCVPQARGRGRPRAGSRPPSRGGEGSDGGVSDGGSSVGLGMAGAGGLGGLQRDGQGEEGGGGGEYLVGVGVWCMCVWVKGVLGG